MDGLGGLHNWQWIFVLEGILTILIGISAYFLLSDFPEEAKWLTEEERRLVIQRAGDHKVAVPITIQDLLTFFKDVKNILAGIMYLCIVLPIYCKSGLPVSPKNSVVPHISIVLTLHSFCLLRPHHHQNPWLLCCPNPATYCSSRRCCSCPLPDRSLPLRPPPDTQPLHCIRPSPIHRRLRHPDERAQ
jgi:hypothetical protein